MQVASLSGIQLAGQWLIHSESQILARQPTNPLAISKQSGGGDDDDDDDHDDDGDEGHFH